MKKNDVKYPGKKYSWETLMQIEKEKNPTKKKERISKELLLLL